MALGDPQIDPAVEEQLYGGAGIPSLADTAPAVHEAPWAWVPAHWGDPEEPLRRAALAGQQLGPGGIPASGPESAPPAAPALQPGLGIPAGMLDAAQPPASPPMPDAITGAGPIALPPTTIAPEQLDVSPTTLADQWQRDPLTNPNDAERNAAIDDIARNDHIRLAQMQIDQQSAATAKAAADRVTLEEDNLRRVIADQDARKRADAITQAKSDQIVADALKLAGTHIDPDRYMKNRGLGQRILDFVAAVSGGLAVAGTGGRNVGLDMLQRRIDQDIDAQKSDIESARAGIGIRQGAVAQEFARTGDLYHAAETVRLATYQATINKMQAEQQNFDSRGTRAIKRGLEIEDMTARAVARKDTIWKTISDWSYKIETLRNQQQAQADARLQHKQTLGLGYAQLQAENQRAGAANALKREDLNASAAAKQEEKLQKFSLGALPHAKLDENGKPVLDDKGAPVVETSRLVQADGKTPFIAPDDISRKQLADKTLAASEINDIINEILDIRDKVGGESSLFNSDAKQRLGVLQNQLTILKKAGTQGMSSDEDIRRIEASLGADSVASFRSRAAGLEEGRDRTTAQLNKEYRIANYTGPKITFPNLYGAATGNTAEEDATQALLQKPTASRDDVAHAAIAKRQLGLTPDQMRDPAVYNATIRDGLAEANATYDPDASPEQQQGIASLGELARGPVDDPGAARARTILDKIASEAHTGKLRSLAKQALESAARGTGSPEVVAPTRDVAHETVPPVPKEAR